jgi:hypothetical protein
MYRDRYHKTMDRDKKKDILKEIVAGIPNNGRFLKRDGDRWVVLSRRKVLIKTAQALCYRVKVEKSAMQSTVPSQQHRFLEAQPMLSPVQSTQRRQQTTHFSARALPHVPFGPADPPDVQAQKTLEMYSQWMVRANEVFWEQVVGPEARALFPEDMIAAVPFSSKSETSFPTSARG